MFRKMRRFKQQLSDGECLDILREEGCGVLSVNGDGGYPYGVPMDFIFDEDDGRIYFHCAAEGHKIDSLRRDGRASFCVCDKGVRRDGDWARYVKSVIAFGRISFVDDDAKKIEKLRKLGLKYYPNAEDVEAEIEKDAARAQMLEMQIEHMTGKLVHEK